MLLTIKTVVFTAMVVAVVAGVAHLSATSTSADPPGILRVDGDDIAVGQVLGSGKLVDGKCAMTHEAVEIAIDLSPGDPAAGVSLRITDECKLIVADKYTPVGPAGGVDEVGGSTGADHTYPRYAVWTRAAYRDLAGIDLATTRIQYNYEEQPDEFVFTFGPIKYCHTVSWWDELECRIDTKYAGSASISATAHGEFAWHITGSFRHQQKATFTARSGGRGTVRCWTNTKVTGLTFHCDGDINNSN